LAAACCFAACKKEESASASKPTNAPASSGNPLTAVPDYLGAVSKAQKSSIRTLDTVQVSQAIQLFHEQEERFPSDLKELVSKGYIASIPAAPYGMKYQYDPNSGRAQVVKQ